MVGADLANLCNEAALLAARRDHEKVQHEDFTDALEKIVLGAPRSMVLSDEDRRRTAYHESGHALVGMLTPGADPVRKVSIIPRGMALGVTLSAPDIEKSNYEEQYLLGRIKVALGGRVAEEIVYGTITAGAESDIQQLTAIARQMVGRWGMSEAIGPIAVIPSEAQGPLLPGASEVSEATQEVLDQEVRRIVDAAHGEVTQLLSENRDKLDSLTEALLAAETLDEDDAYRAAGVERDRGGREEPSRLPRERAAALDRRLAALQPLRRLRAQLAVVGQVVPPRAARVVADQRAGPWRSRCPTRPRGRSRAARSRRRGGGGPARRSGRLAWLSGEAM